MQKTILVTGSTDGIGLETARMLVLKGYRVLLHGRNAVKLVQVEKMLVAEGGVVESYLADLSNLSEVNNLAREVIKRHQKLDALVNNAGVLKIPSPITPEGMDKRFLVNSVAPYLLTKLLLPLLGNKGRVVNVSSAAQAPVSTKAILGEIELSHNSAYAQSKLALIMWSNDMVQKLKGSGPIIVSVNPKSLLGSKMVRESYGISGSDLSVGADILCRAALSDEFAQASGKYFDNDTGYFATPHPDALNSSMCKEVVDAIEEVIFKLTA
ncbi:SDR family NAD(P)-dependent oxidoreductase [Saccharicrinis aurantiacus]|uniref:SDR family NAD(P)-dependent oxidoreductase n=1 Tax=Saccharicrinis aurantiacus TaxID=1849719 RepID=UPI00249091B7|nr:SDR family NAD(P)-dependent oxidoreductase [Saccharicrinis aurantiacus]